MTKQSSSGASNDSGSPDRERLDKVIKQRRLIRSRSRAQRMIEAGRVVVDGHVLTRPGHPIDPGAEIAILSFEKYVGRGGEKLEAALEMFRIDPKGRTCLDIGASTGGLTDCLLQHGAAKVYAIDVGHDQLHPSLRRDDRVVVREGLNARYLEPQDLDKADDITLVTIDVSFISLRLILPPLVDILSLGGEIIALVKPQFEVGADKLPSDGVVKNEADREAVVAEIRAFIESETPWHVAGEMPSPVAGSRGNVEVLFHVS
ncbi:TlyA family RNA methyltransferase [Candidatus Bipolaricaulota bacterium]|nr:TlyA family RNA methyltransferase [Candidatus Bipolaricaulota bacterium]